MRCIIVSNANLKADTRCTYCHTQIGDSYVRKIGTRLLYCGYDCYKNADEAAQIERNFPAANWTVNS